MKLCKTCGKRKKLDEFNKKGNGTQSWCRACQKIYKDKHYKDNAEQHKRKAAERRRQLVAWFHEYKEENACMDCGNFFPAVCMDFDHRPGTKKIGTVAKLLRDASISVVKSEIKKCDLICANCHRIRTAARLAPVE